MRCNFSIKQNLEMSSWGCMVEWIFDYCQFARFDAHIKWFILWLESVQWWFLKLLEEIGYSRKANMTNCFCTLSIFSMTNQAVISPKMCTISSVWRLIFGITIQFLFLSQQRNSIGTYSYSDSKYSLE